MKNYSLNLHTSIICHGEKNRTGGARVRCFPLSLQVMVLRNDLLYAMLLV